MTDQLDKTPSELIGAFLKKNKLKLATAESCTGGMIAALVTDTAGSSAWFDRGFVTYTEKAKAEQLGVNPDTIAEFGVVSEEVAAEMAMGAIAHSEANVAVATTGYAGPDGEDVGKVYIAWGYKKDTEIKVTVTEYYIEGSRKNVRETAALEALIRIPASVLALSE